MKNSIVVFLLLFSTLLNKINASGGSKETRDTSTCLLIKGRIQNVTENLTADCKVELITAEGVVDSVILRNGSRAFSFLLAKDKHYAIRLSKPGYVSKLISVDTKFLSDKNNLLYYNFSTNLISVEESEKLNKDALDFPAAIVYYDSNHETFIHCKAYSKKIKTEIKKVPLKSSVQFSGDIAIR